MSLIIEYEGGYPFIFLDDDLNLAGVFTEFWTIVAQTLHTEFIFQKEVGECLINSFLNRVNILQDSKSTLRNITEERTLTRMDGTKLNADRARTFAYSNAIRFSIVFFLN